MANPRPSSWYLLVAIMGLAFLAQPVAASPILFHVVQPDASGPPYPSKPPTEMALFDQTGAPIGPLAAGPQSVSLDTPAMMHASDNGPLGAIGGTMAFFDIFFPVNPCIPNSPCRTFDIRFDTMVGTVLDSPPPTKTSDTSFDALADVIYSTIPGNPCHPTNPCRINIHGFTEQPIRFTAVDPPGDSFFDIFITFETTDKLDLTKPLFTMTLTGEQLAVPEPGTLMLLGSGLAGIAGIAWRRHRVRMRRQRGLLSALGLLAVATLTVLALAALLPVPATATPDFVTESLFEGSVTQAPAGNPYLANIGTPVMGNVVSPPNEPFNPCLVISCTFTHFQISVQLGVGFYTEVVDSGGSLTFSKGLIESIDVVLHPTAPCIPGTAARCPALHLSGASFFTDPLSPLITALDQVAGCTASAVCGTLDFSGSAPFALVPEPASLLLLGSGLARLAGVAWRRHRK